jgi:integrase
MSRRSGQSGYIEKRGHFYYVRYWLDVLGQSKRKLACGRICPVSGPGRLNAAERKRRAREIIFESGADSPELFNRVVAANSTVTFRQQSEVWIERMQTRRRKPVKPATLQNWRCSLSKWVNPSIGDVPLADVNNLVLKNLVSQLVDAGLSANTIRLRVQTVKMVVASAINDNGEPMYPRKWNHDFLDMPQITSGRRPCFSAEQVSAILSASSGQYRLLYALLAGTGMRIGEALGLEIGKHISGDCSTLTISQSVFEGEVQSPKTHNANREIDLDPGLAALLKGYIGNRIGFLFRGRGDQPISSQSSILKRSLHPILNTIGCEKTGFHSFRRFRVTHLRKNQVPEDLLRFWIGHADQSVTDNYSNVRQDVAFRQLCVQNVGLGFAIPAAEVAIDTNDTKTAAVEQAA